jgi:hypothetical protein
MVEPQPISGSADEGLSPTHDLPAEPLHPAVGDPCVLQAPVNDAAWLGEEHRRLERYPVQASRPIAVRLLDESGTPQGRWFLADILDISRGGLCVLVSGPMALPTDQRLQLDVRCHPDFGRQRLESMVRWCRSSISFTTLGLAFHETLPRVPRLELERRTTRRDPNTEAWAEE